MKKFYWIKLKEAFMSSNTVDYLMQQENGSDYVVLYQMLCLKAINSDGKLSDKIGEITISFDAEKIARDCKWFSVDTVRSALKLYKALGLIEIGNDGVVAICGYQDLVGGESDAASRMRVSRAHNGERNRNVTDSVTDSVTDDEQYSNIVTTENRDKEIRDKEIRDEDNREIENRDKEIEEEETEEKEVEEEGTELPPPASQCPFLKILDLYNRICVSLPKIRGMEGERKREVAARWKTYHSLKVFEDLFIKAENSDFLKGKNKQNWKSDFDWLMKPSNFQKVLEDRYEKTFEDTAPEKYEKSGEKSSAEKNEISERARQAVEATWRHMRKVLAEDGE